jgi:hypothetical protein
VGDSGISVLLDFRAIADPIELLVGSRDALFDMPVLVLASGTADGMVNLLCSDFEGLITLLVPFLP